jgi:hypothetical protein
MRTKTLLTSKAESFAHNQDANHSKDFIHKASKQSNWGQVINLPPQIGDTVGGYLWDKETEWSNTWEMVTWGKEKQSVAWVSNFIEGHGYR